MNSGSLVTLNANRILSLGADGGFIDVANRGIFTINGPITGVGGLSQSWDHGVLVLNGSNNYEGATTVGSTAIHSWSDPTANPTLRLGNSNALPGTALILGTNSQGNTATLDLYGFNATVGALTGGTNAVVDISNSGTSILTIGNLDASGTFQGVLQNTTGSLRLIKTGAGSLSLSGSNSFSGSTGVNAGTLILLNQNALQLSTAILNGGSLVFDSSVNGHAFTLGGLSGVGGLVLQDNAANAVALSVGNNNTNTTYTGPLTGSGSLIKTGTGTLNWTGTNSYTGLTTINSGVLQVSGGGSITQTSSITVESAASAINATIIVDGTGSSVTSTGNLIVGNDHTGTLNITTSGTLVNNKSNIGNNAGSNGAMTVGGVGSSWTMFDILNIGYSGTGTVNVTNGGAVTTRPLSAVASNGASIYVGYYGSGTLNINSSGNVTNGVGYIGYEAGSNGTVNVSGSGSTWTTVNVLSNFYIGNSGTGLLNISNGGTVIDGASTIGNNAGSNGRVNVSGSGSIWTNSGALTVGYTFENINGGTAALNITNGGTVTDTSASIGSLGTVNVDGEKSSWMTNAYLLVPGMFTISGTLNITNGGSVSCDYGGGDGVVNVDGEKSTWTNNSALNVFGNGVLNITHAGTVTDATGFIGAIGSSGTINVDGTNSILTCASGDPGTITPNNTLKITNGSTLKITNGGKVSDGAVTVSGNSTVTVDGTGSTWSNFSTPIGSGLLNTLDISGGSTTLVITHGGTVKNGPCTIDTGGAVTVDGTGSIWNNQVNLSVKNGTLTIQNGGIVNANLPETGITPYVGVGVGMDLIPGTATVNLLTGGFLKVNLAGSPETQYLMLGAFLGDTGILNIGNGGGAGTLQVPSVQAALGSGIINFNHNDASYNFLPQIEGEITVNQIGTGMTILTASNNYYNVATNITSGTLNLSDPNATGWSTVTMKGGSLVFNDSVVGHAFTLMALSATSSGVGYDIALHDNADHPVALTLTNNYKYFGGPDDFPVWGVVSSSYAGVLSGNGSLTLCGITTGSSGTQTLAGANTYTGLTTLIYGTLNLANQNAVQNSTITMNGGSLAFDPSVSGHAFTIGGLSGTSSGAGFDIDLKDSGNHAVALSVGNNNADVTYAGVLSGTGSLNKIGTGVQILSAINTYNGGTTITSGTLELSGANLSSGTTNLTGGKLKLSNQSAVQNSTVWMNNGGLIFDGSVTGHAFTLGGLSASENGLAFMVTLEDTASNPVALTVGNNNENTLFASVLKGTGGLIKSGTGTLLLVGGNIYQGATVVNNGILAVALDGQISQTSWMTVDTISPGTSASLLVTGTLLGSTVTSLGNATIGVSGTGLLQIQEGGLVNLGGISGTGTLTLASGTGSVGTLEIGNGSVAGTLNGSVVTGGLGVAMLQLNHSNANYVFAPQIAGSTAVNLVGPGTTILTASNTHFGATTLSEGILNLKNIDALQNSTLSMNGGVLVFDSSVYQHTFTLGGLSGTSSGLGYDISLQDNAGTPVAERVSVGNNNANTSYAGVLSGSGSLIKIGTGTLTLTGTNSYRGGTTITSGTLQLGNGSTSNGSVIGNITNHSSLVFANPFALSYADRITGDGSVTKTGSGVLTLSGLNDYTGGTNLGAGTLSLGSLEAIGSTGTISFSGGTLQYSAMNQTDYSNRFSTAAAQQYKVDTNSQNVTWATALTSSGGTLSKSGSGRLTLTGSSSYTGISTVAQGTLIVSGSLSASSAVMVGDSVTSGSAVFGGSGTVGAVTVGNTSTAGAILCPDAASFGGSTGTTLTTGALMFNSGSATLAMEIGRTTAGTTAAGDVSSHVIASSVNLNGANLQLTLLNPTTNYTIANNDVLFLIINSGGSLVNGTFGSVNGANLNGDSTFTLGSQEYQISYQASWVTNSFTGGNDVALMAIPEPNTWAMLLVGFIIFGAVQRPRHNLFQHVRKVSGSR